MRLTTRTNLAMRTLMFCAVNDGRIVRSSEIATACNASINHLMQVVHLLHVNGFVVATRGRTGGLTLAKRASDIVVGEVFRVFEAGLPFAECFSEDGNTCPLTDHCRLRSGIARAVESFYRELDTLTLHDLVVDNCGLIAMLTLEDLPARHCAKAGATPMLMPVTAG
ncbi:MAG: Rrf2 family transcriptional regulator [Rhodobacteraceae bacterium]|nr:Rrf2 family transcriptional regulator [Paracoccaceae bacterium]